MTNARSEKVFTSGLYKHSARKRRCVVLATGWYEWKTVKGRKVGDPYSFGLKDKSTMMFAGIWTTRYLEKDVGEDNYAIITTDPNPLAAKVHNRMPVILNASQAKAWLDPDYKDFEKLESFLAPYKGRDLTAYPVSAYVNSSKNTGPQCIEPFNS